jgi:hypothetical protein
MRNLWIAACLAGMAWQHAAIAATPTTADMAILATDTTFRGRVLAELVIQCNNVATEAITTAGIILHIKRAAFAAQVLSTLDGTGGNWPLKFAFSVATNATVIGEATTTVNLTTANVAAQVPNVLDADIGNAIAAQFNSFLAPD